jgi:hypothetical protein
MASFAAVGAGVGGQKVTSRVRVVGSDAGSCEYFDSKAGCDADYALVVDKFQDGTVKGILHDKSLNANNPEENGSLGLRAAIDCLYIFDDDDNGATVAIASSGNITLGEWAGKRGVFTAAKKYPNGTGYYSLSYTTGNNSRPISQFTNCTDPDVIDFIRINGTFFEHKKGKLIIEGI